MNQLQALRETIEFARTAGMDNCSGDTPEVDFPHLEDMLRRVEAAPENFSEAKLGRWLGWVQCAVVGGAFGTLDDMKTINKRNA
jgi:hypothetical protein